jgi:mRNA interferase RelE/StbE
MYKLLLHRNARKDLDRIDNPVYSKIRLRILELENIPRPAGCLKLTNSEAYRIRIGKYRVIYEIDDRNQEIKIFRVLHRKDSYNK